LAAEFGFVFKVLQAVPPLRGIPVAFPFFEIEEGSPRRASQTGGGARPGVCPGGTEALLANGLALSVY
jgi:hypothetical protein